MKKILLSGATLGCVVVLAGCFPKSLPKEVSPEYIISAKQLSEKVKSQPESFIFFYTHWCGASKMRLETQMEPLNQLVKDSVLAANVILIAGDTKIPLSEVQGFRDQGMECYYYQNPGDNPIANRWAIKGLINDWLPQNNLESIEGFQYGIPVLIYLNDKMEVLNPTRNNVGFSRIMDLLEEAGKVE
jgi:hypothetical protein